MIAPPPPERAAPPAAPGFVAPGFVAPPEMLAELLDETDELVCVTDTEGRIAYVNRAWREAMGYTLAEAAALPPVTLVSPEHRPAFLDAARRVHAGHAVDGFEAVLVGRDGRRVVCRGRARPHLVPDPRGGPPRRAGARAYYRDVTAERQHEAVRARLVATLEASPDYVAVKTREGKLLYVNRAGRRLVGLAEDAPLDGRTCNDVRPARERRRFMGEIIPAALRDGLWAGESVLTGPDGAEIPVEMRVVAHPSTRPDDPSPYFISTVARDLRPERAAAEALARLSEVATLIDDAVVIADARGRVTWVNDAFTRTSGYTLADMVGRTPGSVLQGPGTDRAVAAELGAAVRAGRAVQAEVLNYRKDGTSYWLDLRITPVHAPDGTLLRFVAVERDITVRRRAEQERVELVTAVAMSPDGIGLTDADGVLTYLNAANAAMYGYEVADLVGQHWRVLYEPDEAARLAGELEAALAATGRWMGEATGRRRDGTHFPQELQLVQMPWGGLVASVRDISARKAVAEALAEQAVRDELTGLLNRRGFLTQAAAALRRAAETGAPCALLYGDLDRFKQLNDAHGHAAGDDGLRLVARALRAATRAGDLSARLGGDEFVALLVGADAAAADLVSARVAAALGATPVLSPAGAAPVFASMTFGTATWAPGAPEAAAHHDADAALGRLLREADAALYARKRSRR